jgi:quercetin dioxygenase-like cupin family protein
MEVQTQRATTKGPTNWFIGDVYVDPIAQNQGPSPMSLSAVHFAPCAHTAWHRHTLCVTEGEGFVQARGGQPIRIRPATCAGSSTVDGGWTDRCLPQHAMGGRRRRRLG